MHLHRIIELLIEAGVSVDTKNSAGFKAADMYRKDATVRDMIESNTKAYVSRLREQGEEFEKFCKHQNLEECIRLLNEDSRLLNQNQRVTLNGVDMSLLMIAAKHDFTPFVEWLIYERSVDKDEKNNVSFSRFVFAPLEHYIFG